MLLHLDEFSDDQRFHDLELSATATEATALLDVEGYRAADELKADLRTELIGKTVRVRGRVDLDIAFECGRCLEERSVDLSHDVEFVLMERSEFMERYGADDEIELQGGDMDVSFYEGESIDLGPFLREAILLELPTHPRCWDEDQAACDEAYRQNVGDVAPQTDEPDAIDHRWSALKNFKLKD